MARNESDREDLLREATALVPRVELDAPGEVEPVLLGIRSNGSLSVYFGADPMVQFDSGDRLRRACVDGLLYRTQGTTLARLERQRNTEETVLRRHDLTVEELAELCGRLAARVLGLARALEQGACHVRGRVPAADVAATGESTAGGQVPPGISRRMRDLSESISRDGIRLADGLPTRRSQPGRHIHSTAACNALAETFHSRQDTARVTVQRLIIGCGYLGRRVADLWRDRGDHVTVLTRSAERATTLRANGFHAVVGDVLDAASLGQLPRVETVLYAVGFDRAAGGDFRTVTVDGLRNFLLSPAGRSRRMIAISSTSVYGQADGEPVDETSPTEPSRPNGAACLEAEQLLANTREGFAQQSADGLTTVILRLAGIYGPGRLLRRKEQLARQEPLPGPAEAWLNLIHVDDAARAVCAAAEHPDPSPLYLVADDAPVQRMIYYWALSNMTDTPPPVFDDAAVSGRSSPRAPGLNKRCVNSLLRQELLPELRYPSFNEGLPQAIGETGE